MTLVFPMAGLSSRFTKAGYAKPKYMLDVASQTVFYHSVFGFSKLFNEVKVLFIYRDIENTKDFIDAQCKEMGLINYEAIALDAPTDGQAETVYLGLKHSSVPTDDSILIFNIDTFRPNFSLPKELNLKQVDGYLEVFEAKGDHWSFVLPENKTSNKVIKTAEKERISSLCSSGLYYFKSLHDYNKTFEKISKLNDRVKNEFFIAPMYNYLIEANKNIRYAKISLDEIVFCGTPNEYQKLK
jgi:dTDP-glucose pyrophosphorylase